MSSPNRTPGPWTTNGRRVESEHEHGVVNDGWIICDAEGPDAEANAVLLAAAPALRTALLGVAYNESDGLPCWCRRKGQGGGIHTNACKAARAVICKIDGFKEIAQ